MLALCLMLRSTYYASIMPDAKDTYYASIMPDAKEYLLCSGPYTGGGGVQGVHLHPPFKLMIFN